jgi:hypothetical protein
MDYLERTMEEKQSTTLRPMTETLWIVMRDKLGFSVDMSYEIVDAVEEWLPKEHDTNSYEWNKCIKMIRGNLYD